MLRRVEDAYQEMTIDVGGKRRRVSCPYFCDRCCGRLCKGEMRHSGRCDCRTDCAADPGPFDHLRARAAHEVSVGAIPGELYLDDTEEMPFPFDVPEEKTR